MTRSAPRLPLTPLGRFSNVGQRREQCSGEQKADESTIQRCRLAPDIQDPQQGPEDDHRAAQSREPEISVSVTPRDVGRHKGVGISRLCSEIEAAGFRVIRSSNPGYLRRAEIVIRPAGPPRRIIESSSRPQTHLTPRKPHLAPNVDLLAVSRLSPRRARRLLPPVWSRSRNRPRSPPRRCAAAHGSIGSGLSHRRRSRHPLAGPVDRACDLKLD
jgi:hypothetical protein